MRRIRILFEYLAAFIIILLLLFAIASAVVIKYYGDEVKQQTMDLVNERVDTKIYVKEMGISVFRKFPYTSVFFNDVTVWSGHGFERSDFSYPVDTLFTADQVFIQFNLIDLARKKYTVKSLEARNGVLQLFIDKKGKGNYNITDKGESGENPYFINLKGVSIKDYDIRYVNQAKNIRTSLYLNNLGLEGNFSRVEYQLLANGNGIIRSLENHDILYLSEQSVQTNVSLEVKDKVFTISRGDVELGDLITDVRGEFLVSSEGPVDLNLILAGRKVDIRWLLDILRKNGVASLEGIDGSGSLDLEAEISGLASPTLSPHIQADIHTKGASLQVNKIPYPIKSLDFSAEFNNGLHNSGRTSVLNLTSFNADIEGSNLNGSLAIQNFLLPRFTLVLNGNVDLSDAAELLPDLPIGKIRGRATPEIQVNGILTGLEEGMPGISFSPEGSIALSDAAFKLHSSDLEFNSLNGTLIMENQEWSTSLAGAIESHEFSLSGRSTNLLDHFINDERLSIDARLTSQETKLEELFGKRGKKEDAAKHPGYPENIDLRLDFGFDKISLDHVAARNVEGKLTYSYPSVFIDSLHVETMDGKINGMLGIYNLHKDDHLAVVRTNIDQVKIDELFSSFDNFKQDFITSKNIKGKISGDADFSATLSKEFEMHSSGISLESNVTIEDGELNDFQPMIEMSKFLRLDRMDNIEFSTIQNTVLIRDNVITIPEMDIQSSALNVSASGVHSFDKTYDYHLAIKLSEYLFKKAQGSAKKEFEVALDKEDQRTIFLLLYDEGDGVMVEFDEQQAMKKIREDLKNEGSELKVVLHEELGIFKNDEDVREKTNKEETPMFKFEFPDEEPADTVKTVVKEKSRWWKRKKENKQELDFVIEHDL